MIISRAGVSKHDRDIGYGCASQQIEQIQSTSHQSDPSCIEYQIMTSKILSQDCQPESCFQGCISYFPRIQAMYQHVKETYQILHLFFIWQTQWLPRSYLEVPGCSLLSASTLTLTCLDMSLVHCLKMKILWIHIIAYKTEANLKHLRGSVSFLLTS